MILDIEGLRLLINNGAKKECFKIIMLGEYSLKD